MHIFPIVFGAIILAAGILIAVNPDTILSLFKESLEEKRLYILAITSRIVIGATLILLSNISKFPLSIGILGWLILIIAVVLLLMGHIRFTRLANWFLSKGVGVSYFAAPAAIALGGFLIYAFI